MHSVAKKTFWSFVSRVDTRRVESIAARPRPENAFATRKKSDCLFPQSVQTLMPPIALSSLVDVGRPERHARNAAAPFDAQSHGGSESTLASRDGHGAQRGNFAEAMQAANGMQSASGGCEIVSSDNFDTMLIDHLESARPLKPSPSKGPQMTDSTENLPSLPPLPPPLPIHREASKELPGREDNQPRPNAQCETVVSLTPNAAAEGNEKAPRLRHLRQVGVASVKRLMLVLSLLMKFLFGEACTVVLLMVPHLIVLYDTPTTPDGTVATGEWTELTFVERVVQLFYALLAARCAAHLVRAIMEHWLFRILPSGVVLVCQCFLGWPLTVLLWAPTGVCFAVFLPASGSEGTDVWSAVTTMPGFLPATVWWIACAASRGAVELFGQLWLTKLTLSVFEDRTERANQANKALRRIFFSAWVAEDERRRAAERERQRKREVMLQAAKKIRALAEAKEKGDKAAAKRIAVLWKGKLAERREAIEKAQSSDEPSMPGTLRKQGTITSLFSDRKKSPIMNTSDAAASDGAAPALGWQRRHSWSPRISYSASRQTPGLIGKAGIAEVVVKEVKEEVGVTKSPGQEVAVVNKAASRESTMASPPHETEDITPDSSAPVTTVASQANTVSNSTSTSTEVSKPGTASAPSLGANSVMLGIVDGIGHLNLQLTKLAGPLQFGTVFSEAHSLVEASKRARRVFQMIASQPELLLPPDESGQCLVDAKAMLEWAYRLSGSSRAMLSAERTASALSLSSALDEDGFVSFSTCPYPVPRLMRAYVPRARRVKPVAWFLSMPHLTA